MVYSLIYANPLTTRLFLEKTPSLKTPKTPPINPINTQKTTQEIK